MTEKARAYLDLLRRTVAASPAWMREYQHNLLEKMVRHARDQVPFYSDRLAPVFAGDGRFDFDRWHEVPVLTRAAAQQAGADLYARQVPAETGNWSEHQTSGSTGTPLRLRRSQIAAFTSMCVRHRDYERHRLNFEEAVASIQVIWSEEDRSNNGRRRWNFSGKGPVLAFDVRSSVEQQFEWLRGVRARYLRVYPSLLRALAQHAAALPTHDLAFEAMLTFGENVSPETRAEAHRVFGGRVIDSYGAVETGRIASECASCGRYHVAAETALVEVLRSDGTPARPGETGRIVVSSFYNFAMPLLRYEIGDLAEVGPSGECECTLPTLNRIVGRTRNIFTLPDGSRVWPDTRSAGMQRYIGFRQVQVVQLAPDEIEVRYVADGSDRVPDEPGLQEYFRSVIHPALHVRAVAVERIGRSPSGKFEDYISLVG